MSTFIHSAQQNHKLPSRKMINGSNFNMYLNISHQIHTKSNDLSYYPHSFCSTFLLLEVNDSISTKYIQEKHWRLSYLSDTCKNITDKKTAGLGNNVFFLGKITLTAAKPMHKQKKRNTNKNSR